MSELLVMEAKSAGKKGARNMGVRLDESLGAWVDEFEAATQIDGVTLTRSLLGAARDYWIKHGSLPFPLAIQPVPIVREISSPKEEKKRSR